MRDIDELRSCTAEQIPSALRRLPNWPWAGTEFLGQPGEGSLTNQTWLLSEVGGSLKLFVKIPGQGTENYIDRDDAYQGSLAAAAVGVGPQALYYDPHSGVEVSEFLHGYRSCTEAHISEPERAHTIMRLYRELHTAPLVPKTKTVFDMIAEHEQGISALGELPEWVKKIVSDWEGPQRAFLASGVDLVFGQNDMNPPNFMINDHGDLKLIDYDYASNNERAYEVGGFTHCFGFDQKQIQSLIEEYYGSYSAEFEARVRVAAAACLVKWGLWGIQNSLSRDVDFDFFKYGSMRLLQARTLMLHPQWGDWVQAL